MIILLSALLFAASNFASTQSPAATVSPAGGGPVQMCTVEPSCS